MDRKLRGLERDSLSGNPEATQALLWEQERLGLHYTKHYVHTFVPVLLAAGGTLTIRQTLFHNFEVRHVVAISTMPFVCKIKDSIGEWSSNCIHSKSLVDQNYNLYEPRKLLKDSVIEIDVTDISLASNEVRFEFHGIATVVNNDLL